MLVCGERVVDVPASLFARVRALSRRGQCKTDAIDALATARAAPGAGRRHRHRHRDGSGHEGSLAGEVDARDRLHRGRFAPNAVVMRLLLMIVPFLGVIAGRASVRSKDSAAPPNSTQLRLAAHRAPATDGQSVRRPPC